jgi:hypothetical protein
VASSFNPLPAKVSVPALVLVVGGCAAAVGSLWATWAVENPDYGAARSENGWEWMVYGDVLLTITCIVVVAVAVWICRRPRRHAVGLGIGAELLLGCAILGALVIAALTTISFTDFDTVDYRTGVGPTVAIVGLAVAALGVVVAMLGAAPHDRPRALNWHLPHPHRHHTGTRGM